MREFRGTKGEWKIEDNNVLTTLEINGDIVCCPPPDMFDRSLVNWEANAKLIAAAPDLLKACHEAMKYFKGVDTEAQSEAAYHSLDIALHKALRDEEV